MAGLLALWKAWKDISFNTSNYLHNWGSASMDPCYEYDRKEGWSGVHCWSSYGGGPYPNSTKSKVPYPVLDAL